MYVLFSTDGEKNIIFFLFDIMKREIILIIYKSCLLYLHSKVYNISFYTY